MSIPAPYITADEAVRYLVTGELLSETEWDERGHAEGVNAEAKARAAAEKDPELKVYIHHSSDSPERARLKRAERDASARLIAAHVYGHITLLSDGEPINKNLLACDAVILGNNLHFTNPDQGRKYDPNFRSFPNLRILRSKFIKHFAPELDDDGAAEETPAKVTRSLEKKDERFVAKALEIHATTGQSPWRSVELAISELENAGAKPEGSAEAAQKRITGRVKPRIPPTP